MSKDTYTKNTLTEIAQVIYKLENAPMLLKAVHAKKLASKTLVCLRSLDDRITELEKNNGK